MLHLSKLKPFVDEELNLVMGIVSEWVKNIAGKGENAGLLSSWPTRKYLLLDIETICKRQSKYDEWMYCRQSRKNSGKRRKC